MILFLLIEIVDKVYLFLGLVNDLLRKALFEYDLLGDNSNKTISGKFFNVYSITYVMKKLLM